TTLSDNTVVYTTKDSIGLAPETKYPDLKGLKVYPVIAADHLSFPGNDGYVGSSSTHEGGCCTRTNVYSVLTGEQGVFTPQTTIFAPSNPQKKWLDVCHDKTVTLNFSRMYICNNGKAEAMDFGIHNNYKPCYLLPREDANYHEQQRNPPAGELI